MDRRLLFPAVAITAWAQQPSPEAAEAEAALRDRATQFFQMQVDKKYRQAEAMVAEDTKDEYYDGSKYNFKSFNIQKVELLDNNTKARVTLMARTSLKAATIGMVDLDVPLVTLWKIEDGKWMWYKEPAAPVETPFGLVRPGQPGDKPAQLPAAGLLPDPAALQNAVKIDRNSVSVVSGGPVETITVSNGLPGGVDLELGQNTVPGLSVELDKKHLEAREKAELRFRATSKEKAVGAVHLMVSPLAVQLDIQVNLN